MSNETLDQFDTTLSNNLDDSNDNVTLDLETENDTDEETSSTEPENLDALMQEMQGKTTKETDNIPS